MLHRVVTVVQARFGWHQCSNSCCEQLRKRGGCSHPAYQPPRMAIKKIAFVL